MGRILTNRLIPVLLLKGDGLVKTKRFSSPKYLGDPINIIKIFNEKEVDEIVLLDIEATAQRREPNYEVLRAIASECFVPLTYGGGIRSVSDAEKIIQLGFEKVCLNTVAHRDLPILKQIAMALGSQSVVISIDCRKDFLGRYSVFSESGSINEKVDPASFAVRAQEAGAGEIFLTSIDKEGLRKGYDCKLIQEVASQVTIPLIACGGAGSIDHMKSARKAGASALAAGSFFVLYGRHEAVLPTYPSSQLADQIFDEGSDRANL